MASTAGGSARNCASERCGWPKREAKASAFASVRFTTTNGKPAAASPVALRSVIGETPISATRTLYTTFLRRRLPTGKRTLRQKLVDNLVHPLLFPAFVWRLRGEHRHEGHGFWENQTRLAAPNVTDEERKMLEPYWQWCKQFSNQRPAPEARRGEGEREARADQGYPHAGPAAWKR